MRTCIDCNTIELKNPRAKHCRACRRKAKDKRYYDRNRETIQAKRRAYYAAHPELMAAQRYNRKLRACTGV